MTSNETNEDVVLQLRRQLDEELTKRQLLEREKESLQANLAHMEKVHHLYLKCSSSLEVGRIESKRKSVDSGKRIDGKVESRTFKCVEKVG